MGRGRLALFLALTSITIPEFLLGATPLTKIITDPSSFFFFSVPTLFGIYGCGVLLIREAAIAWGKGWPTILSLGLAYGILEEGVAAHTFFDPVNSTVGVLGAYGRVAGIDVTWAIAISFFHAVFSIAIPILFSSILWPEMKSTRIFGRKGISMILLLYLLTVTIVDIILPHRPPFIYSVALFALAGLIAVLARKLPLSVFRASARRSKGNAWVLLLGLFFFPFVALLPKYQTFLHPVVLDAEIILGSVLLYWFFSSKVRGKPARTSVLMAIGLILPIMFFGVIFDLTVNPLGFIAVFAVIYIEYSALKVTASKKIFYDSM